MPALNRPPPPGTKSTPPIVSEDGPVGGLAQGTGTELLRPAFGGTWLMLGSGVEGVGTT